MIRKAPRITGKFAALGNGTAVHIHTVDMVNGVTREDTLCVKASERRPLQLLSDRVTAATCKTCLKAAPKCTGQNGTYKCQKAEGHTGHHAGEFRTAGRPFLATWQDPYSDLRTSRTQ